MRIATIITCVILIAGIFPARGASPATTQTVPLAIFDADPHHLWNRLHRALLIRTARSGREFGGDTLDPLLWSDSTNLLIPPQHKIAVDVLDEFIASRGEKLIDDPLKRAMLLRDLWAIFDWSANGLREKDYGQARLALQTRLAEIISRIALSRKEIEALPDSYAAAVASKQFLRDFDPEHPTQPFLPPDLLTKDGPWIVISAPGGITPAHTEAFDARSSFEVLLRHPEGRAAGLEYIKSLNEVREGLVASTEAPERARPMVVTSKLPQPPRGTQVVLLRRMMLLDSAGEILQSRIVESVQIRVFREIDPPQRRSTTMPDTSQAFFEFSLDRASLLSGSLLSGQPPLRAVAPDEKQILFVHFSSMGVDPFVRKEDPPQTLVMASCQSCHSVPGIHAMNSITQSIYSHLGNASLYDTTPGSSPTAQIKASRFDFGLLRGLQQRSTTQPAR